MSEVYFINSRVIVYEMTDILMTNNIQLFKSVPLMSFCVYLKVYKLKTTARKTLINGGSCDGEKLKPLGDDSILRIGGKNGKLVRRLTYK